MSIHAPPPIQQPRSSATDRAILAELRRIRKWTKGTCTAVSIIALLLLAPLIWLAFQLWLLSHVAQ